MRFFFCKTGYFLETKNHVVQGISVFGLYEGQSKKCDEVLTKTSLLHSDQSE